MTTIPVQYYLVVAAALFCIGLAISITKRHFIGMLLGIELMLNAVNLLLTAFSVHHNDASGQVFVFFIMALAAAEVAVGLAIIVMVFRNTSSTDINVLNKLKW